MPKVIPFSKQAEAGDLHQLALIQIKASARDIERMAEGVRLRARRLQRRSPALAQDLLEIAAGISELADGIVHNAETALAQGERFLELRKQMIDEVKSNGSKTTKRAG